MFSVEYTELATDTVKDEWRMLDKIESLYELKQYGWSRCAEDGKARIYVCYRAGHLTTTVVFYKQNGCVKIKEDKISVDGFITKDMLRNSARKTIADLVADVRFQRLPQSAFLLRA